MEIADNYRKLRLRIPQHVTIVLPSGQCPQLPGA